MSGLIEFHFDQVIVFKNSFKVSKDPVLCKSVKASKVGFALSNLLTWFSTERYKLLFAANLLQQFRCRNLIFRLPTCRFKIRKEKKSSERLSSKIKTSNEG